MKGDRDPATKRKYSRISVPTDSSDGLRRSKRLAAKRSSSTNIYDLPKELLVEILSRLPCAESVCRCKFVSKSWRTLMSDPYFVGRFLWLQRNNQTLIPGTIISYKAEELTTNDVLARLRSFFKLKKKKLQVLATWNDLVLCCTVSGSYCYYYICNPRTMQLVHLPRIAQYPGFPDIFDFLQPVGFICEPYNKEDRVVVHSDQQQEQKEERKVIKINAEYKCKVVRILPPDEISKPCFEFKIQVFSSETGEWGESLVACPQGFIYDQLGNSSVCATNGMLYWNNADYGDLLVLEPLINNKSTTTTANDDSGYQFHVIKYVQEDDVPYPHQPFSPYHLGGQQGRLLLVRIVVNGFPDMGARLFIWELDQERGGELCRRRTYNILDKEFLGLETGVSCIGFDQNDLDICYVLVYHHEELEGLHKYNLHTGERSMINKEFYGYALQVMLPWWSVPTISDPMPDRNTEINGSEEEGAALRYIARSKVKKTKDVDGVVNGEEGADFQAPRLSGRKHGIDVEKSGATKRFKAMDVVVPANAPKEVHASNPTSSKVSRETTTREILHHAFGNMPIFLKNASSS